MQKLKLEVLKRMIAAQLSKYEVLFMITIARYQDSKGNVLGVYYKDICKELGRVSAKQTISYQKYYDCIKSLETKGLIQVEKGFKDRNIRISGNDFSYPGAFREGYISLNHVIFQLKDFGQMKANEMLLCMEFLKNIEAGNRGSVCIGTEKFYDKYTKLLNVSKRVLQAYLTHLRKFFSIYIKDGLYWFEILKGTSMKLPKGADGRIYRKNIGKVVMRRNRMEYTEETFNQTVDLLYRYGAKVKDAVTQLFVRAIEQSLALTNRSIRNQYKWDRELRPKLVHKLLKEAVATYQVIG